MPVPIRGVNLGGWLVIEKWMTPSLFAGTDAVDEHTLRQHPDGQRRIKKHRQTFITENDFKWLHAHNINLVRIPVGHWLFDTSDVQHLDDAMNWAEKHDIQVLIDMHGAPGSQNGRDHSGRIGKAEWFDNTQHIDSTVSLLNKIANRYKESPALWGIELLNEPDIASVRRYFILLSFYRRAYRNLAKILPSGINIVFHDGFHPLLLTGALPRRKSHPAIMDVHWYGFTSKQTDFKMFLHRTATKHKWLLRILQLRQPVIIGEWSGVMPGQFEQSESTNQNIASQRTSYQASAGHIFWTYQVENKDVWNYRHLTERQTISDHPDREE